MRVGMRARIPNSKFLIPNSCSSASGLDLRCRRRHPPRIDHEPQGQSLQLRAFWRRDAVDGAEHAAVLQRAGERIRGANVALELELHEPEQRDRHRRRTLHVYAEVADIAYLDCREARGAPLILPRQPGGEGDGAPLVASQVGVRALERRIVSMLQKTPRMMSMRL